MHRPLRRGDGSCPSFVLLLGSGAGSASQQRSLGRRNANQPLHAHVLDLLGKISFHIWTQLVFGQLCKSIYIYKSVNEMLFHMV